MRHIFGLLIFILCTQVIFSQSYHSINIDGNNDFTSAETFTTSSGGFNAYVTWDENYIYLGYTGNDIGSSQSSSKWIAFYIDTDPQPSPNDGSGTRTAIGFNTQKWTLPFRADYMIQIRTDEGFNALQHYNGSGWSFITPHNMSIWDNNSSNYIEIKIEKSKLGSPKHLKVVSFFIEETAFNEKTFAFNPSDASTNGYKPNDTLFTYYYYYLYDSIQPNSNFHKNNYSWLVRLNASVSSVSSTAYAGMASNATDGFDSGIDLPKPPTPVSNYIEIYFPHSSWTSILGNNYTRDFKTLTDLSSTTKTWNFTINTDRTNSNVTLSASQFDFVPASYAIKIKDLTTNTLHDLKQSNYVYNSGVGGTREFELIIGVTFTDPNISSDASSLIFGTLKTNQDSTITFTLTNTGQTDLLISNVTPSGDFYSYSGPTSKTLSENDTMKIPVKFAPKAAGTFNGSISISSNDPDTPTLSVALSGVGQLLSPNISSYTTALSFGNIKVGNDSTISFYIRNIGDTTLTVSSFNFSNNVFTSNKSLPFSIGINDSSEINVKFTPSSAQTFSGLLKVLSNDVDTLSISLSGTGFVLAPNISANLSTLDFGSVKVDYDSTLSFKIYNTGDTTLAVSNVISSNSVFNVTTGITYNVSVNDSATVSVKFKPNSAATFNGTLKFLSNDVDTLSIDLTGLGITGTFIKNFNAGWNLMSIPVQPENNLATNVIGDDIALFYLYGYSSTSGYQSSNTINAGSGYWLGIEESANIDVTGTPITSNQTKQLVGGWNLLASPFVRGYLKSQVYYTDGTSTVNATAAVDSAWIQNLFYGYNGTSYESKDTLKQWSGYWLLSLKDNISAVFYHDSTSGTPAKTLRVDEDEIQSDNWFVPILAANETVSDNLLAFGVNADATDGFDSKFDIAKPPISPAANAIEAYFDNQGWNNYVSKFASDIKAPMTQPNSAKSWTFKVMSKSGGAINLNWNEINTRIPESVKQNYRFILSGTTIPASINMLNVLAHQFTAVAGQTYSFIINANPTSVNDIANNFSFELYQNYPNPFNPSTQIQFQLAEKGVVSIRVYDILGNLVSEVFNEERESGSHSISFDASNLSSGIYFYKLQSGKFVQTRKMTLIR